MKKMPAHERRCDILDQIASALQDMRSAMRVNDDGTVNLRELFRAVAARVSLPEKKLD